MEKWDCLTGQAVDGEIETEDGELEAEDGELETEDGELETKDMMGYKFLLFRLFVPSSCHLEGVE